MTRFTLRPTLIAGVVVIDHARIGDERGFFERIFCVTDLATAGWPGPVAQINRSRTQEQGVVRGIHFQHAPFAEHKLVSCTTGAVFDVAVDLRRDSPTFLQFHAELLSAANGRALLVPPGCGHGFQSLVDDVEMLYFHSVEYASTYEGGVSPSDPALAIAWPLPVTTLSARDLSHPKIAPDFEGIQL